VTEFGSFDNSTCKRVLDLLEPGDLTLGQVVIKRVAVVELGVNSGSGNGGGCFGIEVWTDTVKLTDMVGKSEVFIKYEADVSSRVGGGERGVVDFGNFFIETNEQKFSLEHREGDLSESEGRKEIAECHLRTGDGLGNKRK